MSFVGLDTEFDTRIRALVDAAKRAGVDPQIVSGYRAPGDQARAINQVSQRVNGRPASMIDYARGIPGYAAPVGGSKHESGNAVDFKQGPELSWLRENAPSYGVRFPQSLARTDPNHAEVDPKFFGPVQHPDDRRAVEGLAGGGAPAEGQAQSAAVAPVAARPPSPAVATAQQAASRPTLDDYLRQYGPKAEPEKPRGFVDHAADFAKGMFTSPLAQAGAAMIHAGSQGQGLGGGVLSGSQAYSAANKAQAEARKQQMEQAAQANRERFWGQMTSQENPSWAKDLPSGSIDFLRALGPIDGPKVAMDLVMRNNVGALDRMKLEETRRDHDIKARQAEAQFLEAQNTNADRALTQDTIRRQKELEISAAQREAEMEAEIFGRPKPQAPAAPLQVQPRAPVQAPMVPRRMSGEASPADPMLIQAQDTGPQAAPMAAPAKPSTVPIPRNGGEDVSPEDARKFGQRLLSVPKYRAMGQDIIQQADAAMEQKGAIGKTGQNEIDKEIIAKATDINDLNQIRATFDPKFLSLEGKVKSMGIAWAEWLSGGKIKPEEQKYLADYTRMATATTERLNQRIKAMSGAAVSGAEEKRMYAANPTMKDSPTVFATKIEQQIEMQRMAIARYNWLKTQYSGTPEQLAGLAKSGRIEIMQDLGSMKQRINETLNQTEQRLRQSNPNIDDNTLRQQIMQTRRQVFGI